MNRLAVSFFAVAMFALALLPSRASAQVNFPGPELLGRPTDHSVTINVVAGAAIQAYFQYGTQSGNYSGQTSTISAAANAPLVAVLDNLQSNTRYFYRMVYRQTGSASWTMRAEHSFYTQRAPGSTFSFTVGSDSHINIVFGNTSLFQQTLQNIAASAPDFYVDLGDTFAMDNVTTQTQANSNYLNMRSYFGLISPAAPIFLALGNHEQEEGWHLDDTSNTAVSPPVLSTNARKQYYPNPNPSLDSFYSGDTKVTPSVSGDGLAEDYYAWQWDDALFVVIDPYWYTTTKPFTGNLGGGEASDTGSGDRWDWTLGLDQYLWLKRTLENSNATYKFIFAHQVARGIDDYGRGGANAVPYVEWGGNNGDGKTPAFTARRPASLGWSVPVHQLLVNTHVTAFFHGHDHQFAYEKRDGIVYQLVPMAADATYGNGFNDYHETDPYTIRVLPNSGHLRVTVSPTKVTVDYMRAFLAGAGTNGQIAYSYNIPAGTSSGTLAVSSLSLNPTSVLGGVGNATGTVLLNGAAPSSGVSVALSSSNPGAASVPDSVTISGAGSAIFPVTSSVVGAPTTATITATLNGSASATVNVNPVATGVTSLALNPTSVVGGSANATATVTLNGQAPATGATVTLSSNNIAAATVPASVIIPSNGTSATFTVTSLAVSSSASATITATFGNSKAAVLAVNPQPTFAPVRIDSGGAAYTDSLGQRWSADTAYSGSSPYTASKTITNTADPTLYKTSRYGSSFSYSIKAPTGAYSVTLKFAEPYWTGTGQRAFNVSINGTRVLSNFDIVAAAGGGLKAVDRTFSVASTGTITIQFSTGSAGNPLLSAIQVVAAP